jgi:hypothetical protein
MPDSDACLIVAWVPTRRGVKSDWTDSNTRACPFGVTVMSFTLPALTPPIWTRLPFTNCDALMKYASTSYCLPPLENSRNATTMIAATTAPIAASRPATVVDRIFRPCLLPDPGTHPLGMPETGLSGGNLQKGLLVCAAFGWSLAKPPLRLG